MVDSQTKHKIFYLVASQNLPFHCPPEESQRWSMHPKVFLSFDSQGKASCPYCGTSYELE